MKDNDQRLKSLLAQRVETGMAMGDAKYKDLITQSAVAYETANKSKMPEMRKAILAYSIDQFAERLKQSGIPSSYIKEAVDNVADVNNPISMMFSMISLLVPNFAYMDAAAVQPMPTETSPIFFQQLTANTTRNGVTAADSLLGGTTWNSNNNYSNNRQTAVVAIATGAGPYTITGTFAPLNNGGTGKIIPGTVRIFNSTRTIVLQDNGVGGFTCIKGTVGTITTNTINYTTGLYTVITSVNVWAVAGTIQHRYDMESGLLDPAQVLYQWATKSITAQPRRLRSIYSLENFYAAKQVLKGVDIDDLLNTSIAGYLNKEISCGVFDDMYDESTNGVTWSKGLPAGVSWAFHRLSMLFTMTQAANTTRKNIARGAGNVLVAGTEWMNYIETLGDDVWVPNKYPREPIGPYNAGTIAGKFTVIKNQGFADSDAILTYKADDTDASYAVGVFIALYNTDPIALDDLKVRRGLGTSIGQTLVYDNSITLMQITA